MMSRVEAEAPGTDAHHEPTTTTMTMTMPMKGTTDESRDGRGAVVGDPASAYVGSVRGWVCTNLVV
jgi:hypothetical protein